MKKNSLEIIFVFLLFIINGCSGVSEDKVIGRYYLVAVDYVKERTSLNFQLDDNSSYGVVNETVFAVGFNDKYIIVKQHPSNNKSITNYYIVPVYKENTLWAGKGVVGPLTLEQFTEKRKELSIPDDLTFTKEIEDLK